MACSFCIDFIVIQLFKFFQQVIELFIEFQLAFQLCKLV
jgi:hypothetical protein